MSAGHFDPTDQARGAHAPRVEVRRSRKRRRNIQAYRDGDAIVVLIPAWLSKAEETKWVAEMVERVDKIEERRKKKVPSGDADLLARAGKLSTCYLNGAAAARSVRWVTNQNARWGSCTPAAGTIRLSHRIADMPVWVVDYVLVHELAHLLESGHGPRFWQHLEAYPHTAKAQGYLEGVHAAAQLQGAWDRSDLAQVQLGADAPCLQKPDAVAD